MHYISEVMGHHSIDFTRKLYARFSPDSASRAVLKVLEGWKDKTAKQGEDWHVLGTGDSCMNFRGERNPLGNKWYAWRGSNARFSVPEPNPCGGQKVVEM